MVNWRRSFLANWAIILLYYCGLSGVISLPSISGFSFSTFLLLSLFLRFFSFCLSLLTIFLFLVFIHRRLKLCACRETGGFTLTYTESPSQNPRSLIFSFFFLILFFFFFICSFGSFDTPLSLVVRFVGSHKKSARGVGIIVTIQ